MQLRVCPRCYKAFYIPVGQDAIICHFCGHIFSERRRRGRVKGELEITLRLNGSEIPARTVDYSEDGAGIIFYGDSLEVDSLLDVHIDSIKRPAKTVWIKRVSRHFVSAGLRLL